MPTYPRETNEFIGVHVTVDGETITDGVAFSVTPVTPGGTRPGAWAPATVLDGRTGFMLTPGQPGEQQVWARVTSTDSPEAPVIDCGRIARS